MPDLYLPHLLMALAILGFPRLTSADADWTGTARPGIRFENTTSSSTLCPTADEILYSPFRPWFHFFIGSAQLCWNTASCVMIQADESRKLQFGATALVMGLVPPTLKDIAWPERRILPMSRQPRILVELVIRTMGLVPREMPPVTPDEVDLTLKSQLVVWATKKATKRTMAGLTVAAGLLLMTSYAALAVLEVYSKRSSLGCVYPVFVLTWFLIAVVPAALHVLGSRLRKNRSIYNLVPLASSMLGLAGSSALGPAGRKIRRSETESAVQGSEEAWPIQLIWAVYYIAGTLIWTSIAAVTVIELFVWVMLGFAVTGSGKLMALFLALWMEKC